MRIKHLASAPVDSTDLNPPRHPREGGDPGTVGFALPRYQFTYQQFGAPIVRQAITQGTWIPAFAGMTNGNLQALTTNFAGMTSGKLRALTLLVLALTLFTSSSFAVDPLPFENRAEEVRFQKLAAELRCLQCQNQNLADSDSALAKDLRKLVFEQMQSGKTDADIKTFLIARYGDFVIYDPPVNAQTAPLWIAPILGFAVLIGALIYRARRNKTLNIISDKNTHKPHQEDW